MDRSISGVATFVLAVAACSGSIATVGNPSSDGGSGGSSGSASGGTGSGGSSGGSGSGGSSGAVTPDQACSDLVTSLCNRLQACAPFFVTDAFGDAATCAMRYTLACSSLFGATGTGVTASVAETCAQSYSGASCDDLLANRPPTACAFQGSILAGAACGEDSQCSADAFCNFAGGQGCGVCSPRLSAAGTCRADSNCSPGLVCAKASTGAATGSCVAPGAQGAACSSGHPCLATLGCSAGGTCGPSLGAGAPCSAQNCDSLDGLYCNPLTGVCALVQTANAGSPCGFSASGSYAACIAGGQCKLAAGSTTVGTCEAPAVDGAACDATNGPPCVAPAACIGGVCKLPDATACH